MSKIRGLVLSEPLFDAHEHQNGYTMLDDARGRVDYTAFLGYASADIATANGIAPADLKSPEAFFNVWRFVRTTGYGQATELACREMLGLPFDLEHVDAINAALKQYVTANDARAMYADLLARANIRWAMNDECWDSPTKLHFFTGREHPAGYRHALRCDSLIAATSRENVRAFEKLLDRSIHTLADLDRGLDDYAEKARAAGHLGGFKCGVAYLGDLRFENSSYAAAERIFEEIMQGRAVADAKPLYAYQIHRLVQRAGTFGLPLQVHTGYLAGNWGSPMQGDPAPLIPLFQRYRNVRFDLFHAGWPHSELMGAIGKAFPNVYLDLCWAWSMTPSGMERTLYEWLSIVPHNKIFAFGGDTGQPFAMLGYALQARRGVANVLERKMAAGEYDFATAAGVARRLLHENACEVYPMSDVSPARPEAPLPKPQGFATTVHA